MLICLHILLKHNVSNEFQKIVDQDRKKWQKSLLSMGYPYMKKD